MLKDSGEGGNHLMFDICGGTKYLSYQPYLHDDEINRNFDRKRFKARKRLRSIYLVAFYIIVKINLVVVRSQ